MRVLVYKHSLTWPRRSGHDVHTYEMMRAWVRLGIPVDLVTSLPVENKAIEGLDLESNVSLSTSCSSVRDLGVKHRGLPERFISYWGIPDSHVAEVGRLAQELKADAVVTSGLDGLPLLYKVETAARVWYAADEWLWHHLSLLQVTSPSTWREVRAALVKGFYERAFRRSVDRIWVVSNLDQRAMRIVSGIHEVDVIPNGVDTDYFAPIPNAAEKDKSLIFWGRLDFEPNVQGLEWFCHTVWSLLISRHPEAVFTIIGARPIENIRALESVPGVRLLPDLDDLRPEAACHQIVVLPFISGGGIKNKLLEAAAMGKTIVCSTKGATGLSGTPPVMLVRSADEWLSTIEELWSHPERRSTLASSARRWVSNEHTWERAAVSALKTIPTRGVAPGKAESLQLGTAIERGS
jgi:glycosyltransferase involved in cell wall biosynthesis